MIRVAVFDDNHARREGLCLLLESMDNMEAVAAFPDCRDVVERVRRARPDVVLMDINMPNVDGIEGLRLLKQAFPDLKVIMQTIFEDEDKILEAISAGADGYILKQKSPMKLLEGITDVMEGGAPMTPIVARKVLQLFSNGRKAPSGEDVGLTPREREILGLLVEGHSYKMIAAECHISYSTVNKHVSHIYEKLQVHSVAAAVSKAIQEGLV
jgi:DNA-binding NarL/FixJ family response regulator